MKDLKNIDDKLMFIPSDKPAKPENLALIKKDFMVQIRIIVPVLNGSERFWVCVDKIENNRVTGKVDADLNFTSRHGVGFQDPVEFATSHIQYVMPPNAGFEAYTELAKKQGVFRDPKKFH